MMSRRTAASTDGLTLAYWVRPGAQPSDKSLLLIHGGASNHTRWSEFVDNTGLRDTWHLVAPDMRGNGESMTRGRQDMTMWCGDLVDVLDAEGIGHAVIAGHSLGAQIAINFAHRNPARTRGLILIDPVFQKSLTGRLAFVRRYRWFFVALKVVVTALNRIGIYRRHIEDRDLRELDAETREAISGAESFDEIAKRYGALGPILKHMPTGNYLRQSLATISPLPPLPSIEVPVLVLLSGGSTLANIELNREQAAQFPDSEIVVLDANHWPLTETPDAVRDAIDTWVTRRWQKSG